ncbi:MBOAT family O-acyltransferase [Clostridium sp. LP20]|uniref:MBOAT family O-acyltransferase n=1 Tax=Clostridium sp. LP20 TaxID=3418665 RepID=UPI003EE63756
MIFNSLQFLIFFPIVVLLYFIIPNRFKWGWLLVCSYYFYISWNPKYVLLIATSTIVTYMSGIFIGKACEIEDKTRGRKLKIFYVVLSLAINLGILFFFKYYGFFSQSLVRTFEIFNISLVLPKFDILQPVGISFYTFQALSYTIDVYRGDIKPEKNLGKYALFVSFFPQLVAGPIEKSKNLLNQFNYNYNFDYYRVKSGLLLMLWGFFQKVCISDRLAIFVNSVYDAPESYAGFQIVIATIFFAFQLYCDFSSYSDIAIGAAKVMGFTLTNNFRQPYLSKSIKEFWQRWHITLGGWFKDYLYIPLGGNRKGKIRLYLNLMIVFLTSGLWHGASINFVIWGGLHGLYQIIGDITRPIKEKIIGQFKIRTKVFSYKLMQILITFVLVDFAWIFFRASSFQAAKTIIKNMVIFNPWTLFDGSIFNMGLGRSDFFVAVIGIIIVIFIDWIQATKGPISILSEQNLVFRWAVYVGTIILIVIFGVYGPGYSAQQFIYSQF